MLTVYGIETITELSYVRDKAVATVLTVYGIETIVLNPNTMVHFFLLQQCLPFTVLKLYVPGTKTDVHYILVATVLTVYGIET